MIDFLIGFFFAGGGRSSPPETETERRERLRAMLVLSGFAVPIAAIVIGMLVA